jgi:predicted methyltransferase
MLSRSLLFAAFAALSFGVIGAVAQGVPAHISAAVNDPARPPADKMRDANRKPAESVAFASVKPGDKVVDFLAGGGYFTRILSKAVGPQGHVYATAPGMPMGAMAGGAMPMGKSMPMGGMPAGAGAMPMGGMGSDALTGITTNAAYSNVSVLTQPTSKLMVPEPVDVVWTSQNYHDLHNLARSCRHRVQQKRFRCAEARRRVPCH